MTNFGANGAQGVIITAGHLGPFFLLSSDRQGFLPKRLGVSEAQGQICGLTAPSERSVLEYPLWLQGVPGRSPGAKCIVFVSFKHVQNASGVCFEGKDLNRDSDLDDFGDLGDLGDLDLGDLGVKNFKIFLSAHCS